MSHSDAELLDYLECEANDQPLVLHYGGPGTTLRSLQYRGLGLRGTGRSLREAIAQMMDQTDLLTGAERDQKQ